MDAIEYNIFQSTAERLGWNIDKHDDGSHQLSRFSSAGQDFSIIVEGKSLEELTRSVYNYWQNYDPDAETMLWADSDGHGKKGAPHRLRDILDDMEECERNIEALYLELSIEYEKQPS